MDADLIRIKMNITLLKEQRDDALEHAHNCIRRSDVRTTHYWMSIYKDILDSLDTLYAEAYRLQSERKNNES